MKVTVLYGGPSDERKVSLVSGQAVIDGLRQAGHEVFPSDVSPADLSALDKPADVIFPVLHGKFGEDGQLQQILEQRRLRFVGSGSRASQLGFDKVAAKQVWDKLGLATAPYRVAQNGDAGQWRQVGLPCVIKAIDSGSSIDVFICNTDEEAARACATVAKGHGRALIEKFIRGIEITCGILEERPLPLIRIRTTRDFYDYTAKYEGNFTEHLFDTGLSADGQRQAQEMAMAAHQALGCRDLSRVDMIVEDGRPVLLEINTLPGFTPKSLLPKAAGQAGIEFAQLVDRLARRGAQRSA